MSTFETLHPYRSPGSTSYRSNRKRWSAKAIILSLSATAALCAVVAVDYASWRHFSRIDRPQDSTAQRVQDFVFGWNKQ